MGERRARQVWRDQKNGYVRGGRAREARISGGAVAMLHVNESESDSDESDSDPEASGSCKDAGRFKRDVLATMAEVGARGGAEARREGGG